MTGKGYIKSEERSSDFNVTLTANVMNNSKEKATISVFLSAVFTIEGMKTFTEKTTMKLDNKGRVIVDGDGCILSNDPAPLPTVASVGYKSDKYIYTCKDGSINFSVSFLEKGQYDYVNFIEKTYEKGKLANTNIIKITKTGKLLGMHSESYLEDDSSKISIEMDLKQSEK